MWKIARIAATIVLHATQAEAKANLHPNVRKALLIASCCYTFPGKRSLAWLLAFTLCSGSLLWAQEPQIASTFPLGGRQGSTFEVKIRGKSLDGTYGVWFDCDSLKAEVKRVEEIDLAEKGKLKK